VGDLVNLLGIGSSYKAPWWAVGLAIATMAVGGSATQYVAHLSIQQKEENAATLFERQSERVVAETRRRVTQPLNALQFVASAFDASENVTAAEFKRLVLGRNIAAGLNGVMSFGYIERKSHSPTAEFLSDDQYIVRYLVALEGQKGPLGKNLGVDPTRREAIERAIVTGLPTITPRIRLVYSHGQEQGFLMLVPIYDAPEIPKSQSERIRMLKGLVYAPIRASDLLAGVTAAADRRVDLHINDGSPQQSGPLLFDADHDSSDWNDDSVKAEYLSRKFQRTEQLAIGQRIWTLTLSSTPRFEALIDYGPARIIAGSGFLITFLISLLVLMLGTSRDRAVRMAVRMNRELLDAKASVEQSLQEFAALLSTLEKHAIVTTTDRMGRIIDANEAFCKLSGYEPAELIGKKHSIVNSGKHSKEFWKELWRTIAAGRPWRGEICNRAKDGSYFWVDSIVAPIVGPSGDVDRYIAIRFDITARKLAELQAEERLVAIENQMLAIDEANLQLTQLNSELHQIATTDTLTKLLNRHEFRNQVMKCSEAFLKNRCEFSVLFIDLDNFKYVNDTLGHEAGDQLLVQVAQRLKTCLRGDDIAARLGGDEFAVLLRNAQSVALKTAIGNCIVRTLQRPFDLNGRSVVSTGSVGIADCSIEMPSEAEQVVDHVMRCADTAMYHAKNEGKSGVRCFEEYMLDEMRKRLELELELRRAIESRQFKLHYQPVINLDKLEPASFEARVRWQHPTKGLIPPDQFIPLAEELRLIVPLGEWILDEACRQLAEWNRQDDAFSQCRIAVNVSGCQFMQMDMVDHVAKAIRTNGIRADQLVIEITETFLLEDKAMLHPQLNGLRAMGVRIALDDFGTGYSSMSSLSTLPIDSIKIDKSFVQRLGDSIEPAAVLRAIITLSSTLGMTVVGEGIETEDQFIQVQALGCDFGQGYFFAKPLKPEEVVHWRAHYRPRKYAA
jgi:diguanylate cyclase (GGDEF)-like protein/PAS domain S-box-containing protein